MMSRCPGPDKRGYSLKIYPRLRHVCDQRYVTPSLLKLFTNFILSPSFSLLSLIHVLDPTNRPHIVQSPLQFPSNSSLFAVHTSTKSLGALIKLLKASLQNKKRSPRLSNHSFNFRAPFASSATDSPQSRVATNLQWTNSVVFIALICFRCAEQLDQWPVATCRSIKAPQPLPCTELLFSPHSSDHSVRFWKQARHSSFLISANPFRRFAFPKSSLGNLHSPSKIQSEARS